MPLRFRSLPRLLPVLCHLCCSLWSAPPLLQDLDATSVLCKWTNRVNIECRTAVAISATKTELLPTCTFLADHVDAAGELQPHWLNPPPTEPVLPALLGTTRAVSQGGRLTFTDLRVARSGGAYRLRFARVAGALVEAVTSNLHVATGKASRLFLKRQPGVSSITGWILQPQPTVLMLDAGGNVVTDPAQGRTIHVTLLQYGYPVVDTNCEPGQQAYCRPAPHMPPVAAATSAGVASFTSLQVNRAGAGYTLIFCDGPCRQRASVYRLPPLVPDAAPAARLGDWGAERAPARLRWVESWPPLSVQSGSAYKAVLWRALAGCIAGLPCAEQPVVVIQDRGGNILRQLPPTDVAASIYVEQEEGAASTPYTLTGRSSPAAAAAAGGEQQSEALRDLVATTVEGRADFADVQVNLATPKGHSISISYAASIYNLAIQTGLRVSGNAARLVWDRQPPRLSRAGVPWPVEAQPAVLICDANGVRVEADSRTVVTVALLASSLTLAAGNVEGQGARDAATLVLGNAKAKCCRGRCAFTDLAIGLAGSGFKLQASATLERLHVRGLVPTLRSLLPPAAPSLALPRSPVLRPVRGLSASCLP